MFNSYACTGELVHNGNIASLNIVAAHDSDDMVSARKTLCFFDLINVTVVERVVFADNTVGFHINIPFRILSLLDNDSFSLCNVIRKLFI